MGIFRMNGFISLYRIMTGKKVSSFRLLLYVFFGYALSGRFDLSVYSINTLIVAGGILFASLLNDFYDYLKLGEENAVAAFLKRKKLNTRSVKILIWLPWIGSLFLFFLLLFMKVTLLSLFLLWASFILCLLYSSPPARLKERKFWGLTAPPIGIFMLFFQALSLISFPDTKTLIIAALVFIYTWYLDFLHLAEDAVTEHETKKLSAPQTILALRFTGAAGIIVSLLFSLTHPLILVSVAAWTFRFFAVFRITPRLIMKYRKNIFSRIYRIEEFMIYVIVSILHGAALI